MLVDGQTGVMKTIVAFRNFANEPKNVISGTKTSKATKMNTFWQFSKSLSIHAKSEGTLF